MATFWATFSLSKYIKFSPEYTVSKHGSIADILRFQKWFVVDVLVFQIGLCLDILAFLTW
jgi:hypothetical protein